MSFRALFYTASLLLLISSEFLTARIETGKRDSPMGPLSAHSENPRYFMNQATGEAVYLTGSHTWSNLVDMGPTDPPEPFDFTAYLEGMTRHSHNFMRLWTWELVNWDTRGNNEESFHHVSPLPYARTGPGQALDGKPRFDLTRFDPAYFHRLEKRIAAAREQGVYVSVMLFEGWGLQFSPGAWESHPFHPENNVNRLRVDRNNDGKGLEVHELGNERVTAIQEAYVLKVIDTVSHFDNVLYEISNENHPGSTEWQYHFIRFIKENERERPLQHPVGMTFQYKGGENEVLFKSPADWISPNPEGGYREDPPAAEGQKVILNDTDHLWGIGGNRGWVWRSFTRGLNPIFMDPYDGAVLNKAWEAEWEPIRVSMGHTREYEQRMDLASSRPDPGAASTGYCLSDPGKTYLVYAPEATEKIQLEVEKGTYRVEWFNPESGRIVDFATRHVDSGEASFVSPIRGESVLFLERVVFPAGD